MTISVLPADRSVVTGSKAKARRPKIIAGNCAIVLIGPNQNGSSVGAGQAAGGLPRVVISAKNNMSKRFHQPPPRRNRDHAARSLPQLFTVMGVYRACDGVVVEVLGRLQSTWRNGALHCIGPDQGLFEEKPRRESRGCSG
jgi:hypothetical protein